MKSRRKKKPRYYVAPRRAASAGASAWVWAVTILLLGFAGFIGWRIVEYGHFDDDSLLYNGWVRLGSLSLVVGGLITGAFFVRKPTSARRMHAAVFIALLLHLGLLIAVDEVYLTIAGGRQEEPEPFVSLPDFGREEEQDETLDPVNDPTEVATPRPEEAETPTEPPSPQQSQADRATTDTPAETSERQPATAEMERAAAARPHQGREQSGPANRSEAAERANPQEAESSERLNIPAPVDEAQVQRPNIEAAEPSETGQAMRRDDSQPAAETEPQRTAAANVQPERDDQSPEVEAVAASDAPRRESSRPQTLDSPDELAPLLPAAQQGNLANIRPVPTESLSPSETGARASRNPTANQAAAAEPSSSPAEVAASQPAASNSQPALAQSAASNRVNRSTADSAEAMTSDPVSAPAVGETTDDSIAANVRPTDTISERSAANQDFAGGTRSESAGSPAVAAPSADIDGGAPARVTAEATPTTGSVATTQGGATRRSESDSLGGIESPTGGPAPAIVQDSSQGGAAGGEPSIDASRIGDVARGETSGQSGAARSSSGGNPGIQVVEGGIGGPAGSARSSANSSVPAIGDSGGSSRVVRAAPSPTGELVGGVSSNPLPVEVTSGRGDGSRGGGLTAGSAVTATERSAVGDGAANGRPATGNTGVQLSTGDVTATVAALNRRGSSAGDATQPQLSAGSGASALGRRRASGGQPTEIDASPGRSLAVSRTGTDSARPGGANLAGNAATPGRTESGLAGGGTAGGARRAANVVGNLTGAAGQSRVAAADIGPARSAGGQPSIGVTASTGGARRTNVDGASVGDLDEIDSGPLPTGSVATTTGGEPGDDAGPAALIASTPGRSSTGSASRADAAGLGGSSIEGPSSGAAIAAVGLRRASADDGPRVSGSAASGGGLSRRATAAGDAGIELAMAEPLPTSPGAAASGGGPRVPTSTSTSKSATGAAIVRRDAAAGPAGLLPGPTNRDLGISSPLASSRSEEAHLSVARLGTTVRRAPLDAPLDLEVAAPAFKARDPIARRKTAEQRGGTPATEEAVERGLAFLAKHQLSDGRWSLQSFADGTHGGTVEDRGTMQSDSAATGLALLAYLGAGYTHQEELGNKYREVVQRGLAFLTRNQKQNGDLFTGGSEYCWLYSHGIAAIAVCEAYGMTHDEDLKRPAQRAIDFIVAAQNKELGGWRYKPGISSDTSVSGWQLMAMKSAEMSGLEVPASSYALVKKWLDHAQSPSQPAQYIYRPGAKFDHQRTPSHAMTAESMLMRLYLGWEKEHEQFGYGADYLLGRLPSFGDAQHQVRDTYYWYYGTQVMFHVGGERWNAWNEAMKKLLTESQVASGPLEGSWDPLAPLPDKWGPAAGRIYVTAMHLLMLEVYYRHLPLYSEKVTE